MLIHIVKWWPLPGISTRLAISLWLDLQRLMRPLFMCVRACRKGKPPVIREVEVGAKGSQGEEDEEDVDLLSSEVVEPDEFDMDATGDTEQGPRSCALCGLDETCVCVRV
jgi:hypothetical protein